MSPVLSIKSPKQNSVTDVVKETSRVVFPVVVTTCSAFN